MATMCQSKNYIVEDTVFETLLKFKKKSNKPFKI